MSQTKLEPRIRRILLLMGLVGCLHSSLPVVAAETANEVVVRRYFDEWANKADDRSADELISQELVMRHGDEVTRGLDSFKKSMLGFHAVFPDVRFTVEDLLSDAGKAVVRWRLTGTQKGEFMGRPPSGKAINITGMSLFRLDGGKIQEIWVAMDRLAFMRQLGLVADVGADGTPSPKFNHFDLRIYTVTANKLEGVLERFRETVDPVRRRLGIKTIGYWSAPGTTNGGTFAYLLASESRETLEALEKTFGADPEFKRGYAANAAKFGKTLDGILSIPLAADPSAKLNFTPAEHPRAFDLRLYTIAPGKLEAFRNRWRDHAAPIYARHGLASVGWWVAAKPDAEGRDQFICLLAGESVEAIQKGIAAFHADPDWITVERETEKEGKLRVAVTAHKLLPADFSELR